MFDTTSLSGAAPGRPPAYAPEDEIDIRESLLFLHGRWWVMVPGAVLFVALGCLIHQR